MPRGDIVGAGKGDISSGDMALAARHEPRPKSRRSAPDRYMGLQYGTSINTAPPGIVGDRFMVRLYFMLRSMLGFVAAAIGT